MEKLVIALAIVAIILLAYFYYPIEMTGDKTATVKNEPAEQAETTDSGEGFETNSPKAGEIEDPISTEPVSASSWADSLKFRTLDPATKDNHEKYVKDVRIYSKPASRAVSVADDNNNPVFTNYISFFKPQYVPVGASARQQNDVDYSVLKRNDRIWWRHK